MESYRAKCFHTLLSVKISNVGLLKGETMTSLRLTVSLRFQIACHGVTIGFKADFPLVAGFRVDALFTSQLAGVLTARRSKGELDFLVHDGFCVLARHVCSLLPAWLS